MAIDSDEEAPPPGGRRVSRRNFIYNSALATGIIGGLGLFSALDKLSNNNKPQNKNFTIPPTETPKPTQTPTETPTATPAVASETKRVEQQPSRSVEKLFSDFGLEDFLPFYKSTLSLSQSYYSLPEYTLGPAVKDQNLALILDDFVQADGKIDASLISLVKDGWGEKTKDATKLARDKVTQTTVIVDKGLMDKPEAVKVAYSKLADLIPHDVLTTPDRLEIVSAGGSVVLDYAHSNSESDVIQAESPAKDLEGFFRTMLHELAHTEVFWVEGKPYTNRKDFADLVNLRSDRIKYFLDYYFGLEWPHLIDNKGNQIYSFAYSKDDPNLDGIKSLEENMTQKYNLKLDQLKQGQDTDPNIRFYRLIHTVGHYLVDRKRFGVQLTDQDKSFLDDPDVKTLMRRIVLELDHYFVGPVQRVGGGLPGSKFPVSNPSDVLTRANEVIQQARLKALSTLSPTELANFESSSEAIRVHLGLDKK